jgi:hypothetical protein
MKVTFVPKVFGMECPGLTTIAVSILQAFGPLQIRTAFNPVTEIVLNGTAL